MAKLLYVLALISFVQIASALECYTCEGTTCENKSSWSKVESCGKSANPQTTVGACLKMVYTDKAGKETTSRKCVVTEKGPDGKPNFNCKSDGKVSTCEVCTSDLCNSAPAVSFSFVTLLGVVAAYLIPKYI